MKDKDNINVKSSIVYEIPCKDCDRVYIGQTKRYMKIRIREHKNNIKNAVNNHTSLTKHRMNESHSFDYKTKVICVKRNYTKRITKEMTNILRKKRR